jgi:hypothetical protein
MAHQRPPDRAARVQVVRPAGRSTWTRSARPGRDGPAPPGSPTERARRSSPTAGEILETILRSAPSQPRETNERQRHDQHVQAPAPVTTFTRRHSGRRDPQFKPRRTSLEVSDPSGRSASRPFDSALRFIQRGAPTGPGRRGPVGASLRHREAAGHSKVSHWRVSVGWCGERACGILGHVEGHPLVGEAQAVVAGCGLSFKVHEDSGAWSVDMVSGGGTVVWRDYAHGPDQLLAIVSAEQRYLAEECGGGTVDGATYLDKARERLRRWEGSRRAGAG